MKNLLLILLVSLSWVSCQNNPEPKALETPAMNAPGQPGAAQDLDQAKEAGAKAGVAVSESELVGMSKSVINGSNVNMRKEASVRSEKIGTFDDNESVESLESLNVQNEGEAILSKSITVKGTGGTVTLPKGKAVVVENYFPERNTYLVSYEDPKKGKLGAEIDASAAETIIYATWIKVRRKTGETGWVLGKFLKTN